MVDQKPTATATSLMGLFAPPPSPKPESISSSSSQLRNRKEASQQQPTHSQVIIPGVEQEESSSASLSPVPLEEYEEVQHFYNEHTPLLSSRVDTSSVRHPSGDKQTPKTSGSRKIRNLSSIPILPDMTLPPIEEVPIRSESTVTSSDVNRKRCNCFVPSIEQIKAGLQYTAHECATPSTWIGGFMFLLFQLVYCLTMGATIGRPYGTVSMLGFMTKMAALGIIFGAPVYWFGLSDVPAMYPTVDLFAAPFLANMALIVDEELYHDPNVAAADNDPIFLATFIFLASVSLFVSGSLLILASVFKLANLGSFLPFPVLCGFFSAVGVLTWTLAFKVDTSGLSVQHVFLSGDPSLMYNAILHHLPSLLMGSIMKYLTAKNQFFTIACVGAVIAVVYLYMFLFGVSMDDMIEKKWFWSTEDLHYDPIYREVGSSQWTNPAPFGWINAMYEGKVHWGAVAKGLETAIALSFLYLIRCSLHGAALKKNASMLSRVETVREAGLPRLALARQTTERVKNVQKHKRVFSEAIDIEQVKDASWTMKNGNSNHGDETRVVKAKPSNATLKDMLLQYGYAQYVCGIVGSFAVVPCIAVAPTMFTLKAERLAPQLLSVILLSSFYLTNFELVGFIPKTAFSSLLVMAFLDMLDNWFFKSFFKTKEKMEWAVVPLIVFFSFVVGLLEAVFVGIAAATFLFVGTFFRSGVVKYIATGLNIRSTIERSPNVARWLDQNADQIQILVLQNYLFFGNASGLLAYVTTMFEAAEPDIDPMLVPPIPIVVILDLTLVTGIDTSAVDAFSDILAVCGNHDCKLFFSGVSENLRDVMKLCGIEPENIADRSKRKLRFFSDLDGAVGKAEDILLKLAPFEVDSMERRTSEAMKNGGFQHALTLIDEQHQTSFAQELSELETYTTAIDLEPGDQLYEDPNMDRGLFFIEHGIMKIERTSDATVSRGILGNGLNYSMPQGGGTLNSMNARAESIGMEMARLKASGIDGQLHTRFRVARVGPGWIIGNLEALAGAVNPGNTIAVTNCRLHYISYQKILEIEQDQPLIILRLYKLLSYLMAKRQEITISQLGTLHSIMSAPARKNPLSRSNSGSALATFGRGHG